MRIVDSHFHWWPRSTFDVLCGRKDYPRAERNGKGGYTYWREPSIARFNMGTDWVDLDEELAYMDKTGHEIDVVCSTGPISCHFSDLPLQEGRDAALRWNEEMAAAQRKYAGRLWASAVLPLTDCQVALEVLDDAVGRLGLMGVNMPGSIGSRENIDVPRLEPLYARIEELGLPVFLHPSDAMFTGIDGYNGALYTSLGRVIDVSVAAYRLVLSGIMERYPRLKIIMSHTGGALPYQAGRMDKNSGKAGLPKPPTTYLKRMYTDTVTPHAMGLKFAVEFYGVDHVMYGSDYPCWSPEAALKVLEEAGLSPQERRKVMGENARRVLGLDDDRTAAPAALPRVKRA
jgi:aminocarboxymuconate-semialdehyde decarboxylase